MRSRMRGFTLVEVMIASALLTGLMLAVVEITRISQRSNLSVSQATDWNNMYSQLQLIINNEQSCQNAFAGITLPAAWFASPYQAQNMTEIDINGAAVIKLGAQLTTGLNLSLMQFQNTGQAGVSMGPPNNYMEYTATFTIKGNKVDPTAVGGPTGLGAVGGRNNFTQTLTMLILVDGTNTIKDCFGQVSAAQLCYSMGGNYNSSSSPPCPTFVRGCQWSTNSGAGGGSSPASASASCTNGMYATGGGGSCPSGTTMTGNMPTSASGSSATGWTITCENATNGVNGTINVQAFCCND